MHLLLDVRTSTLSDRVHISSALIWADAWKVYHPHDTITFLAYEGDPVEGYECIFLRRSWKLFEQKIAAHAYGPDRIISFSQLPSIDTSIPIILHIYDLTDTLYPLSKRGIIDHHIHDYRTKKKLKQARHIIIPSQEIGANISELYNIDESKMSVIPYITAEDGSFYKQKTILPMALSAPYFLTECTPGEEWHPIELLRTFAHYIHDHSGDHKLVMVGDLGGNLGIISTLIRSLDILDAVKIIGVPGVEDRHTLYAHAAGWIYVGHYYSRGASVALADGYGIPLYLSDIPGLGGYRAHYLHPNHIHTLAAVLAREPQKYEKIKKPDNTLIMEVYAQLIAS